MKQIFFILSFAFMAQVATAQKVYSANYQNQADIKIFVVDYVNQADLKVFKVDYSNQAQ